MLPVWRKRTLLIWKRNFSEQTVFWVGELDWIVPISPQNFCFHWIWRIGPDCPEFLLQKSMYNNEQDLKLGGEWWDVIAPIRGREAIHTISQFWTSDE